MIDVQHIDELKYPIGNGTTNPIIGIGNNKHFVIKTNNNVQGNRILINELVCYLLALELELPIPNSKLCLIDQGTIVHSNVENMEDFSESCYGLGFCSEYIENSTVLSSHKMIQLTNNHEWLIPKLMLFDHLIYNKDRNKGNLLLKMGKDNRELILIDHSHTFNLECIWDKVQLHDKINNNDYKDEYIMEKNAYIYSKLKKCLEIDMITMADTIDYFKNRINNKVIGDIIDKIPTEWESNKEDLEALKEYLIYRFNNIEHFADIIISYKY